MRKIVVDANVFVSAVLGGSVSVEILRHLTQGRFKLLYSPYLLQEVKYVLSRKKFRLSPEDITNITAFLKTKAEFVLPTEKITDCRDPKDNPILECAWAGPADAIVTGDQDLLHLNPFRNIPILTPRQFLDSLPPGTSRK